MLYLFIFYYEIIMNTFYMQQIRKQRIAVNRLCVGVHKGEVSHFSYNSYQVFYISNLKILHVFSVLACWV